MSNPLNNFIKQQVNPKQLLMNFMKQQNSNNPIFNNLIDMQNKGNDKGVEQFARNIYKEQIKDGDFDKDLAKFKQFFNR